CARFDYSNVRAYW
nr:immunoglobulin heavy chain junction region [Mus musculus]